MRLRNLFRVNVAISFAAILLLAVVLVLWRASRRASDVQDLARALQQQIVEQGITRDEYLLHWEARAQAQWYTKTARLKDLLRRAASAFEAAGEGATIGEMEAANDRARSLFDEIVGPPEAADESKNALSIALRERVAGNLLLLSNDLYSRATRLAESASMRARSTQKTTLLSVMGLIGGVLVISVVNAMMTGRLVERRITRLRDGAERVAAGNLGYRIAIVGSDELAELGQAFDTMAARLQESHVALEGRAAEVATLNEELQRRVAQLEASNKDMEAFSYSVSHDLRAPLRSLDGFSRVLDEDYSHRLDAEGRRTISRIVAGARRMGDLIDDLLKLSRVSRGELRRETVDLSGIAGEIVASLARGEPERKVEVVIAEGAVVEGDPQLLRLAMENLLGNAFKFTSKKSGARIEFGVERNGGEPVYFVRDDGAGFDLAYAGRLFGPFQRLHPDSEFPGTGIGLATVKRIVTRHGGRIWAQGEVGRGATFSFTLGKEQS